VVAGSPRIHAKRAPSLVDGSEAMTQNPDVSGSVKRRATRADLDGLPENVLGEVIDGVLYTFPRPRARHALATMSLGAALAPPFMHGRGGPGGWWILIEPGIELPDAPEIVPDLAGWHRERMPHLPEDTPIAIAPDWACEVLSPSTRSHDQLRKRRVYARSGVGHLWFVDPDARTLSVSRLEQGRWVELGVWGEDEKVRVEPFGDLELELSTWWPAAPPVVR
jgi:Uma2 family endonuclease